jgi:putative transposase
MTESCGWRQLARLEWGSTKTNMNQTTKHRPNSKNPAMETSTPTSSVCRGVLDETLRLGAQRMLQQAIEAEVENYINSHGALRDAEGHRQVVRNGFLPERQIQTGIGPVRVRQPRVQDRRSEMKFTSAILPPYLRRVPSLENLIPTLYLKGVSTAEMGEALAAILGDGARGLSPANIVRLKEIWEQERAIWEKRDLSQKHYVYLWADGIYFNVRLTDDRPCVLVIVGAQADGSKELVALIDGERESKQSWKELLSDLKRRGLTIGPKLAVGDGALGFWAALEEEYPGCKKQRCWVHKIANVLDKMAKSVQPKAKKMLHEIYLSPDRKSAGKAMDEFVKVYEAKYPKACECLKKDRESLLAFYDFPAEHWVHLRTSNPIESAFATVRHRHRQTKGNGSRAATLSMVYKLGREAEKGWRKLNSKAQLDKVIHGVTFADGIEVEDKAA